MATEIRFGDNLASQNIVIVYKDEKGDYYLGHSFYYGGRNSEYLMFLYKDKLPMDKGLVAGWNYLDDNSVNTVLVGEENNQIAVEDFLYAHGMAKDWKKVTYREVPDFMELDKDFKTQHMNNGEVLGYVVAGSK
jgi:hypothetical protein